MPPVKQPKTFTDGRALPQLIVFDLDYTLWPFWVDTHVAAPIRPVEDGLAVVDKGGDCFTFYEDVAAILGTAHEKGISLSCASRTHDPKLAVQMLRLLRLSAVQTHGEAVASKVDEKGLQQQQKQKQKQESSPYKSDQNLINPLDLFIHPQIYPGSKKTHFHRLRSATGIPYAQMLFFDDEMRNRDVESLGVVMWHVPKGVSIDQVDRGIEAWRNRVGSTKD